jgi:UDP-N-acetylglucosamine enolpyruvyl transferase
LKVGQFCRSAEGATEIGNCYQIQRGYEHIDLRMRGLGADVELLED